jgi:hypothetical protein
LAAALLAGKGNEKGHEKGHERHRFPPSPFPLNSTTKGKGKPDTFRDAIREQIQGKGKGKEKTEGKGKLVNGEIERLKGKGWTRETIGSRVPFFPDYSGKGSPYLRAAEGEGLDFPETIGSPVPEGRGVETRSKRKVVYIYIYIYIYVYICVYIYIYTYIYIYIKATMPGQQEAEEEEEEHDHYGHFHGNFRLALTPAELELTADPEMRVPITLPFATAPAKPPAAAPAVPTKARPQRGSASSSSGQPLSHQKHYSW